MCLTYSCFHYTECFGFFYIVFCVVCDISPSLLFPFGAPPQPPAPATTSFPSVRAWPRSLPSLLPQGQLSTCARFTVWLPAACWPEPSVFLFSEIYPKPQGCDSQTTQV